MSRWPLNKLLILFSDPFGLKRTTSKYLILYTRVFDVNLLSFFKMRGLRVCFMGRWMIHVVAAADSSNERVFRVDDLFSSLVQNGNYYLYYCTPTIPIIEPREGSEVSRAASR